ncbi:MAG: UPF0301 protein [Pirellulaceae bacterium]|nr:MAG: UPF0301 protein [Pirellulaceae bacterium]
MNPTKTHRFTVTDGFSLEGQLLVATPKWEHATFGRTVCYVIHHGSQGSLGVILNRTAGHHMAAALSGMLEGTSRQNLVGNLYLGGPNPGPVVAIHRVEEHAEFASHEGICFTASLGKLRQLLGHHSPASGQLKVVVGQAQWGPGQLDAQLAGGCWLVLPAIPQLVFADSERMWSIGVREAGNRFLANLVGSRILPPHCEYN